MRIARFLLGWLLVVAAQWAGAESILYFNSPGGDYIGGGSIVNLRQSTGSIFTPAAQTAFRNGISVTINASAGGTDYWSLYIAPPAGQTLATRSYEMASRFPFQPPLVPGLDFSGNGRGCNKLAGRFIIWELQVDANGVPTQLAVDFEQSCEISSPPLIGQLRFNSSVPVTPTLPRPFGFTPNFFATPGAVTQSISSRPVNTPAASPISIAGGEYSLDGGAYTAAAGTVQPGQVVRVRVTAPSVRDTTVTPVLTVGSVQVPFTVVADPGYNLQPHGDNLIVWVSETGDPVGSGNISVFSPSTLATFVLAKDNTGFTISSEKAIAGDNLRTTHAFGGPAGAPLAVGTYAASKDGSSTNGRLSVDSGSSCSAISSASSMKVLEIQYDNAGLPNKVAIDFVQYCNAVAAPLRGFVRINSSVPITYFTPPAGSLVFNDQTNVRLATRVISNAITINGVIGRADLSVSNGEFSVGCTSGFTTTSTFVVNGQTVCVRHTSARTFSTTTVTTLSVGGIPVTFRSTTEAATARDSDGDGVPDNIEVSEGLDSLVKDNDVFSNARLFVMQTYRDFLGREGDAGGIGYWTGEITGGRRDRLAVMDAFLTSPEIQSGYIPVARLYFAYLKTVPDVDGLDFWSRQVASGALSIQDVADAFAASSAFRPLYSYPLLNDREYVQRTYRDLLGRDPTATELNTWLDGFARQTTTRGRVVLGIAQSQEYINLYARHVDVVIIYRGILKRPPDDFGLNYWLLQLNRGSIDRRGLIAAFLGSAEYRSRFLP